MVANAIVGISKVTKAGTDDYQLASLRLLQDHHIVDLHVGPAQALYALGAGCCRHRPTHHVVCQLKWRLFLHAAWAGLCWEAGHCRKKHSKEEPPETVRHMHSLHLRGKEHGLG